MIIINRFIRSWLMASVALFSNYSLARGDTFKVSTGTSVQNGSVDNALDGDGDTLIITPEGSIEIKQQFDAVVAIKARGLGNTINNSGKLTAESVEGNVTGIFSEVVANLNAGAAAVANGKALITNSGIISAIVTGEGNVTGIFSEVDTADLQMNITNSSSGSIVVDTVGDGNVFGILSRGHGGKVNISNFGTITISTVGDGNVFGIYSRNLDADILNSGSINASTRGGGKIFGIYTKGAADGKVNITNSGTITSTKDGNRGVVSGIISEIGTVCIFNFGTISVSTSASAGVSGILVKAPVKDAAVKATILNSGIITASTTGSGRIYGLYISADVVKVVIRNSGVISASTTGVGAVYGVPFSHGGSIVNSGTITASRIVKQPPLGLSYAVGGEGAITISNSGSIIGSVKNDIAAINLMDGGSLEFGKGSFIVGEMLLGGDTSISIDGDQPRSLHYVFGGAGVIEGGKPQVSGSYPAFYSEDGREVAILDTRYLDAGIDALEGMTANVSRLTRSRRFVQDVSKSHVWISGAVSRRANGKNDGFFALNNGDRSFAAGIDGSASAGLSVGGLVGSKMVAPADKVSSSHDNSTDGLFAAVHAIQRFDHVFLQTAVSGGILKHNDVRFIQDNTVDSGIDIARSSYHSYWASPEVTLGIGISAFDWTYTPSVNLRYARQWVEAYGEEGSTSNVNYNWRSISLLSGRAGLAVDRQFSSTHLTLRAGFQSFGLIGRNNVSFSMLDGPEQTFEIQSGNKRGIYGGVDVALQFSRNASLTLGGRTIFSKDKMDTHLTAGLDIAF